MSVNVNPVPFGAFLEEELPSQKDWIATGVLPRGGTLFLAGASKTGKSFFCLELCRALALGDNPFGHPQLYVPEPARVLYVEAEVKQQGLQARGIPIFQGVNHQYLNEHLFVLTDVPEMQFDTQKGFGLLREALDAVQPNVLIIDPYGRFIAGLDENSNSEMNKVLTGFDRLLKDYKHNEMSLVLAHHAKKPNRMDQQFDALSPHEMRGSSRFFSNPDSILMLDRDGQPYINPTGQAAWKVKGRLETRQAERLPDMNFTVNHRGDLRVHFTSEKGPVPKIGGSGQVHKDNVVQMGFAEV